MAGSGVVFRLGLMNISGPGADGTGRHWGRFFICERRSLAEAAGEPYLVGAGCGMRTTGDASGLRNYSSWGENWQAHRCAWASLTGGLPTRVGLSCAPLATS